MTSLRHHQLQRLQDMPFMAASPYEQGQRVSQPPMLSNMGRSSHFATAAKECAPPPPGGSQRIPRRQLSEFVALPPIQDSPGPSPREVTVTTPRKPQPPAGKANRRVMRRSNLLHSLHPVLDPTAVGRAHFANASGQPADPLLQTAALPERSARAVLRLSGEVWETWDCPSFRGDINLLQCFVDGQSVHEHLLKGIVKALPVNRAEVRVANFAEQEVGSKVSDIHIPSVNEDDRSAILVTLFIGRVLSTGALADLRRCLNSVTSGTGMYGLDLGHVCGTAEVVSVDVSASFKTDIAPDQALSRVQLARSMGQCFLFGILCEGEKEKKPVRSSCDSVLDLSDTHLIPSASQECQATTSSDAATSSSPPEEEREEPSARAMSHPVAENTMDAEAQLDTAETQDSVPLAYEPHPPATPTERGMVKRKSGERMPSHDSVLDLAQTLVDNFDSTFATKSNSKPYSRYTESERLDESWNTVKRVEEWF